MANRNKILKTLLKIGGAVLLFIVVLLVWFDQSRSFYCLSENQCVTVWKRLGNKCYIIPGKYFGIVSPSNNYIKTINTVYLDVIFRSDKSILVNTDENVKILNQSSNNQLISLYSVNKTYNDSLYTYFDGKYQRYKDDVEYIGIDVKDSYAVDRIGNRIK